MPYKYRTDLERCSDKPCPSDDYRPGQRAGYRYLHNPARVPANFKPPAYMPNPPPAPTCGSYALSFAISLDVARKRYKGLLKRFKENTALRYGDHIGLIDLTEADGAHCSPDKHGHFDLHEEDDIDWTGRVRNYWPARVDNAT